MRNIVLVATGGTIASSNDKAAGAVNAGLSGEALLASLHHPLPVDIAVTVENFEAAGSYALDLDTVRRLCQRIAQLSALDGVDGIVITHGTDTMEESAFLAALYVPRGKPVVFTGAQRHAGEPDTDGPRNIRDAILVAATAPVGGLGPVIQFEGDFHAARYVTKAHTSRTDTFRSIGLGKLGEVDGDTVRIYAAPFQSIPVLDPAKGINARVELVALGLGCSPRLMELAAADGASGIVLSAFGRGNAPRGFAQAVEQLVGQGIPVIVASRCHEGRTKAVYGKDSGGVSLVAAGAQLAGDMSAIKARLLLAALLGQGLSGQPLAEAFATYC